jgi:hypothetical protein
MLAQSNASTPLSDSANAQGKVTFVKKAAPNITLLLQSIC